MSELMSFTDRQKAADEAVDKFKYTLYGGAVGGGKSYFIRRKLLKMLLQWYKRTGKKGIEVGLFCEDYPTLKDRQLSKIVKEFPEWLGVLHDDHKAHGKCWMLHPEYGGGIIKFRNLDDPSKYQSAEFAAIAVDELTKNEKPTFLDLKHRLRWPGIEDTRFFAGTNPGGPGHAWVKKLWIDRDYEPEELSEAGEYYFVPAKAEDNPNLPESYLRQLDTLPDDMRKALRDGDWDIFKGQYFYEWRRDLHVVEPFPIPDDWKRFVCGDYGFSAPAAVYWCALSPENILYVYRELYVTGATYADLCKMIVANTPDNEKIEYWVFDPAIWSKDGKSSVGMSGAEIMEQTYAKLMRESTKTKYLRLMRGNNDRLTGWGHLRERLKPKLMPDETIGASIRFFATCTNAIRSIPSLVFDKNDVEDCDSRGEDHAADAIRYGLMSEPRRTRTPDEVADIEFKKKMKENRLKSRLSLAANRR